MLLTVSAVQFYVGFFLEKDDAPYVICTILVFGLVALIWYLFFKPKREQKAKEFAEQKWNTAQIIKGTYVNHKEFAQQTSEHHWVTDYIVEYKDDKQRRKKAFVPKCEFDRYVDTYPGDPVWVLRYPNFKGGFAEMVFNFDSMEDCTTIFKK